MAKSIKLWASLGVAAVSGVALAGSVLEAAAPDSIKNYMTLADNAGEGGEGGGEGGGGAPAEYSLQSTDPDAFNYDAAPQIAAYTDLVVAAYGEAEFKAKGLQTAIDAFLAAPSEATLGAARKSWVEARPAYLATEAFRFYDGPIEAVEGKINAWPMNEAFIDYVDGKAGAGIVNDTSKAISLETINALDQSGDEANVTTGWHAIEFLLWGQDLSASGPGNRPYTDYISGQGNNGRRREYLKLVSGQLVGDITSVAKAWNGGEPESYASKFKALPPREALGRMLNGMAILAGFEFMSERLAVALDSGDQEDEHSCFSDTTYQDFVHDFAGIKSVWTGDSGGVQRPGLDELLRARDPALADKIDALIADAEAKIAKLGDPWDQVLAAPKDSPLRKDAEAVVTALQALGSGLVEAGGKLGVLVLIPAAS